MTSYNIIDRPCIPVVDGDEEQLASLREVFERAPELQLSVAEPLAVLPLARILIAILGAADSTLFTADGSRRMWDAGRFDMEVIDRYLESQRDAFDLFGSERPFLQVAGLEPTSGPPKSAAILMPSEVVGNSVPLFSVYTEADRVSIPVTSAFLGLLILQAYDTAAIKPGAKGDPAVKSGKTTGNHTGYLGSLGAVIPWGRNLFETLVLNLPHTESPNLGRPTWEEPKSPAWEIRQPNGLLELFTWQSRRLRLVPNDTGDAVVGCVIAAGDRMHHTPENEPHTRWQAVKNPGDGPAQQPMRWQSAQSAWRGVDSLIARLHSADRMTSRLLGQISEGWLEDDYPLDVFCVGVTYGNKSAVIEDVFVDSIPIPVASLMASDDDDAYRVVAGMATQAEEVRQALNNLQNNLRVAAGGERIEWDSGDHLGNSAMALLDVPARAVLTALQRAGADPRAIQLTWERAVTAVAWQVADPLLDAAPPQTFLGHANGALNATAVERIFRAALRKSLPLVAEIERKKRTERKEGEVTVG